MLPSFSIKFYLNLSKSKSDLYPIYIRIIINRKKAEVVSNFCLNKSEWDENKQRAKKNLKINEELSSIENEIYEIIKRLDNDNKLIDAITVKNILTRKENINVFILEFFSSYINRLVLDSEKEDATVSHYRTSYGYIEDFIKSKNQTDILVSQIDFKFISDLDLFLMQQFTKGKKTLLGRNTINKHHSRLRTILLRAIKEEHITKSPYRDFKLKNTPSKRTYLSDEELQRIIDHPLQGNESLIRIRDLFIFSTYTGLRFQDAQELKTNEIFTSKEGEHYIDTDQRKTGIPVHIPLLKPAIDIINKYDDSPERKITGKILPEISNQKVNIYLKIIANLTSIEKNLSHHVARHTCATTILLSNEVPIEVVSKWLGHTNIRTTQIYAKITNKYLHQVAKRVNQKLIG